MSASAPKIWRRGSAPLALATNTRACASCLHRHYHASKSSRINNATATSESSNTTEFLKPPSKRTRVDGLYGSSTLADRPKAAQLNPVAINPLLEAIGRSEYGRDKGETKATVAKSTTRATPAPQQRNEQTMAAKLNPRPRQAAQWERKKVIQSIQRRGRLSKTEVIKRTERELISKSNYWRTSMKRLAPLARQIAGKTIEDAKAQMRFSKKKYAKIILDHLEEAELKAVVERGMNLGLDSAKPQGRQQSAKKGDTSEDKSSDRGENSKVDSEASSATAGGDLKTDGETANIEQEDDRVMVYKGVRIGLKDGSNHTVYDPSSIYIDQAWVNKGSYGQKASGRARGRIDTLRLPQTSITVLLKEEATRVREHKTRQEREAKKKVWVQLPNRPIQGQRPYYCW